MAEAIGVSILDRYIFRTVLTTILLVLVVLLVLDSFISMLDELQNLSAHYDLLEVIRYLLLTLPGRAYDIVPVALLVGGLLGMGALASHSELIVMRGAGRSLLRLVAAALLAGLVVSVVATLIGEFVAPVTQRLAQERRFAVQTGHNMLIPGYGFWARDGNNLIRIGTALAGPILVDIDIYSLDQHNQLKMVIHARRAYYRHHQWVLDGVERSVIQPEAVTTTAVPQIAWNSVITPNTLKVLAADPSDLAMRNLLTYIRYLRDNGLNPRRYELAFWTKALAPLANLSMLLIAMPFAFTRQRSAGVGQRLVIGILLGLGFFLLNRMLGNIVLLYGFPPIVGAALPMLLFYGAGGLALRRVR